MEITEIAKSPTGRNSIVAAHTADESSRLFAQADSILLTANETLHEAHSKVTHVYFPHEGLISFLVVQANGWTVEAGIVGSDGAACTVYSPVNRASYTRAKVVSAGSALRLPVEQFEWAISQSDRFRDRINQNDFLITARAQQAAACNLLHHLEPRLCRWLLQVFESSGNATVGITQASLSQMLGVNRTRLNKALRELEAIESISHARRGELTIINPGLIADRVCDCYREMRTPNRLTDVT